MSRCTGKDCNHNHHYAPNARTETKHRAAAIESLVADGCPPEMFRPSNREERRAAARGARSSRVNGSGSVAH